MAQDSLPITDYSLRPCSTRSLGILISTFERNKNLAHWTAEQIKRHWAGHPPIFFSGLNHHDDCYLGFLGDEKDWMGVTLEAVKKMRQRGFSHAYLILDDHPPIGPCHEEFLNKALPALARALDAACIGLLGHGQHRKAEGEILSKAEGFLERCPINYRWKFSLHPGLWNLESLQLLLESRREIYEEQARTAWNFELYSDDPNDAVVGPLLSRCYRISGEHFLKQKRKMKLQFWSAKADRFIVDVMLYGAKLFGGPSSRQKLERKLLWLYGHYLGPYPLFWSGTMQQGKPHEGWERWLKTSGDHELQEAWLNLKRSNC